MFAGIRAAFIWWYNQLNNAVCGSNSCKLLTLNLRTVVDAFKKKKKGKFYVLGLFFSLDFVFFFFFFFEKLRMCVMMCCALTCLNVFSLFTNVYVCRYKEVMLSNKLLPCVFFVKNSKTLQHSFLYYSSFFSWTRLKYQVIYRLQFLYFLLF